MQSSSSTQAPLDTNSALAQLEGLQRIHGTLSCNQALVLRRLKSNHVITADALQYYTTGNKTITSASVPNTTVDTVGQDVLDALHAIKTTPYESTLLSRIIGHTGPHANEVDQGSSAYLTSKGPPGLLAVDWITSSVWMNLMTDVKAFFRIANSDCGPPNHVPAPISYVSLQKWHLPQVHDLLSRMFWDGIDVTDSLDHSPEQCTVLAMYKKLVVGLAIISSPQETYITYLAVRAGWEGSRIASTMLYYLLEMNPHRDFSLHVSANNPAMLLYNRFGFKAEEFIVDFYNDYLDENSRASKNAFRLRLRR